MVEYQKVEYRELSGDFQASVAGIEVKKNDYYDANKSNSTPEVLDIRFTLIDPESWEEIDFTQRFVTPLIGGKGLFQQLLDAYGFEPNEDGGSFDEDELVGLKLTVTMDKNKKGYDTIVKAVRYTPGASTPKAAATQAAQPEESDEVLDENGNPLF